MNLTQGYSYHIKDSFYAQAYASNLMANKESHRYRPNLYAIQDNRNPKILWMIPLSSKVEKYKKIRDHKIQKYKKCPSIIIGSFAGQQCAFLIQNSFPIIEKYLNHIHTVDGQPVKIHEDLQKQLATALRDLLHLHYHKNYSPFFPKIDIIYQTMVQELSNHI